MGSVENHCRDCRTNSYCIKQGTRGRNSNLSDLFVDWHELKHSFEDLPDIDEIFDEKWELIKSDLFQGSVLFDPPYWGKNANSIRNYNSLDDARKKIWQGYRLSSTDRDTGERALKKQCNLLFPTENEDIPPTDSNPNPSTWDYIYSVYEAFRAKTGVFDREKQTWKSL